MKRFNPSEIEPKWQARWDETQAYTVTTNAEKPKMYVSGMFPYPSGSGLHSGHAFSYTIVDTIARFYRPHGYNVLNPMGWDTFGLPAENYAIKTGTAPAKVTAENIANFKHQFKRMGVSVDWNREINTSNPEYYKWTQWVFTEFFKRGLAYQKESAQWWCPVDKTVLANEQVEAGKCWRCGSDVEKKSMKQWFFKITDYADALLEEIPSLDWPDKIKTAQTNWIGKSSGAEIEFQIESHDDTLQVFTTRPDTIFGATFMVVAPEHPIVRAITTEDRRESVDAYVAAAAKKSEVERMADAKEKTGVFTGASAINPATGELIPIWLADYVLYGYGTGAIMAVPAHDERDKAFAEKFDLPIKEVVDSGDAIGGEGKLVNSANFNGMLTAEAREEIVAWLESQGIGKAKTTYKMRDWLISRQRYWGAPIPIIHCSEHGAVAVPQDQLPVTLPVVEDYAPKGDGRSALAAVDEWVNTECPTCEGPAKRETDTMDGYACSSWYLLRYADPKNGDRAWSPEVANYWNPVDYYVGGDHAVAHLLYVRFWAHVFNDMGLLNHKEPVKKLVYHGYVNAEDGRKMSKSLGNVIDPLDIIDQGYGADTLRAYVLFMGPIELDSAWSSQGVGGVYRFLNRVWTLAQEYLESEKSDEALSNELEAERHRTIKKVTEDYKNLGFNTAIASLMEYVNVLYKAKMAGFSKGWQIQVETLVQLLSPIAPHMTAEIWEQFGHAEALDFVNWPKWDESKIATETVTVAVQVNGKLRGTVVVAAAASQEDVLAAALADENVQRFVENKELRKTIYVPSKLLSLVV